ncbi:hypothetical protein [Humisphaera borealis]|uniref:Uncharacterized protein n=1 Tax=Humisphaera borealis TaxID=2807512 RepID=A0A7M2X083_9BACT|nr:hypothetical protein [Humisphaera borealis]QOV91168.1 hypothetical protein IPV69_07360 [Humisphaera borealis]
MQVVDLGLNASDGVVTDTPADLGVGVDVGGAVAASVNSRAAEAPRHSRAEQSRINGAKSCGPTSDAGKSVASQNAWNHGLRARGQLLPDEDPAVFDAFVASYRDDLGAVGPCQAMLAERVAEMAWKLQRMPVVRSAVLCSRRDKQCAADGGFGGMDTLGDIVSELRQADVNGGIVLLLQRYECQVERSMQAALRELRILQGGSRGAAARAPELLGDSTPGVTLATETAIATEPVSATPTAPATSQTDEAAAAVVDESRVRSAESKGVATATVVSPVAPTTGSATFHPDDLVPADVCSRVRSAEGLRGRVAPVQCDHYGRGRSASRRG